MAQALLTPQQHHASRCRGQETGDDQRRQPQPFVEGRIDLGQVHARDEEPRRIRHRADGCQDRHAAVVLTSEDPLLPQRGLDCDIATLAERQAQAEGGHVLAEPQVAQEQDLVAFATNEQRLAAQRARRPRVDTGIERRGRIDPERNGSQRATLFVADGREDVQIDALVTLVAVEVLEDHAGCAERGADPTCDA